MALKFEIMGEEFNQKSAQAACSKILRKNCVNTTLSGNDFDFIKYAFENHHYNKSVKFNSPIIAIEVKVSENGKNIEFLMHLESGESKLAGIRKCFMSPSGIKKAHAKNVKEAARNAIRHQQDHFRHQYRQDKKVVCNFCGEVIDDLFDDLHVDHSGEFGFDNIFNNWAEDSRVDVNTIAYKDTIGSVRRFVDEALEQDWITYHKKYFRPMPSHARCNQSGKR